MHAASVENICADVYLPPHIISLYPHLKERLAAAIQSVIETMGVQHVLFTKQVYDQRKWLYGVDVKSQAKPSQHNRPVLPDPIEGTSRYRIWGLPENRARHAPPPSQVSSPSKVSSPSTSRQQNESAALIKNLTDRNEALFYEVAELTTANEILREAMSTADNRVERAEENELMCMVDISERDTRIASLEQALAALSAPSSTSTQAHGSKSPTPSQGSKLSTALRASSALTKTPSVLPSTPTRSQGSRSQGRAAEGRTSSLVDTSPSIAMPSFKAAMKSPARLEPSETRAFGMATYKVVSENKLGWETHSLLCTIQNTFPEENWEGAIACYVSVKFAEDIANAMRIDVNIK